MKKKEYKDWNVSYQDPTKKWVTKNKVVREVSYTAVLKHMQEEEGVDKELINFVKRKK